MAVGLPLKTTYANGDVYSASDVNDTNGTINLLQTSTLSRAAGKNILINGGMDIWQRGTSISLAASTSAANGYTADRWDTATGANQACTISRQATGDTTNLPNIQYALRYQRNSGQTGTGEIAFGQSLETVNSVPYAGQTVILSFYARKGANFSPTSSEIRPYVISGTGTDQNRVSGGYTGESLVASGAKTLTTTWQRFTINGTVPTTSTELAVLFAFTPSGTAGANDYWEITGVQLELGSVATTFSRAGGGGIQGELAACQRYYVRFGGNNPYNFFGVGEATSTTAASVMVPYPVTMRTAPTSVEFSNLAVGVFAGAPIAVTGVALDNAGTSQTALSCTGASGLTLYRPYALLANGTTSNYLAFNAEL